MILISKVYFRILAVVLLLFGLCPSAQADGESEWLDSSKVHMLDGVVATGKHQKFELNSPMPMQKLSGKDLEKLNSFSVADAIRYFSGVQLKDYGGVGGLKTVNVRSLGSAHTTVFYDGVAVGNAQNGTVDLGKFSLDNIEAIELYNGQKSNIFQPAKGFFASNTLFMHSKTPKFVGDEKAHGKVSFKTGSFGLINPALLYEQKLSGSLSLSASAEYVYADGKYKYRYRKDGGYDTTAVRQNGDINALRAELTLHQVFKSGGRATYKAYIYDSERGLPGAVVANIYGRTQRQWDRNFFFQGMLHKSLFKNHDMMINLKYARDYTRYVDSEYIMDSGDALDNKYYQDELYMSMVNQLKLYDWWDVSLSTDFFFNTMDANLYRFPYPNRYSYYGALNSAMKWDRLEVQANALFAYVNEDVKYYADGDDQSVFNPVLSVSYQPFASAKGLRLRAFYKESFRMPTFNDLYYTFVGNTSLRPELTRQVDVGATWIHESEGLFFNSLSIQADGYYNRVKDKIVAMPGANLFRWIMMNLGEVEVKGFETNIDMGFTLPFDVKLNLGGSYTFQQAVDITPDGTTYGDYIPYSPVHSGSLLASALWKDWNLNYSFIYTGERYSQKANTAMNYVQPWYTSDLGLMWTHEHNKMNYRVGLEVNNIFNQSYDVVLNFPMPGTNVRLTLAIQI
ncbi:MAG: TonB-dependent receptor plug domain-containing protein [Bacteroidales bacterium]